jgi:cell division septation protein DedD
VRVLLAASFSLGAFLAPEATAADSNFFKPPAGCPVVQPHAGLTSGDWEAVFGLRKLRPRAVAFVKRVRGLGFRCAVFEREHGAYEVAVIGLRSRAGAMKLVLRARKKGLPAYVARS